MDSSLPLFRSEAADILSGPSYAVPARRYLGGISVSSPLINDVTVFCRRGSARCGKDEPRDGVPGA